MDGLVEPPFNFARRLGFRLCSSMLVGLLVWPVPCLFGRSRGAVPARVTPACAGSSWTALLLSQHFTRCLVQSLSLLK
jgi:hypothetical protein